MPPEGAPLTVIFHPHVGQQDAILNKAAEIFDAPGRLHGAYHGVTGGGGVLDLKLDGIDLAALNGVEPFVPLHHEGASRTRTDEYEFRVHECTQPVHVLAAQGVAPLALKPFNHLAVLVAAQFVLPASLLGPNFPKAKDGIVSGQQQVTTLAPQRLAVEVGLP
jgi:hypothetical protein